MKPKFDEMSMQFWINKDDEKDDCKLASGEWSCNDPALRGSMESALEGRLYCEDYLGALAKFEVVLLTDEGGTPLDECVHGRWVAFAR